MFVMPAIERPKKNEIPFQVVESLEFNEVVQID